MTATLEGLPTELLEIILLPLLQQTGTVELQAPIWADKTVFVPPIYQVCKRLRQEAIRIFYHSNVFVWVIDPDEIRAGSILPVSRPSFIVTLIPKLMIAQNIRRDPTQYPLLDADGSKDIGPRGDLMSPLPWYYEHLMQDLRHLRLNLFLPSTSDMTTWTATFPHMFQRFANALDRGSRITELKILIGTWHKPLLLREEHAAAFDVLASMQVRGTVQVRTQGIFDETKKAVRALQLDKRMKENAKKAQTGTKRVSIAGAGGKYLDWDWEGGGILS